MMHIRSAADRKWFAWFSSDIRVALQQGLDKRAVGRDVVWWEHGTAFHGEAAFFHILLSRLVQVFSRCTDRRTAVVGTGQGFSVVVHQIEAKRKLTRLLIRHGYAESCSFGIAVRVNLTEKDDVIFQFALFHSRGCKKLQQCGQRIVSHFRCGGMGEGSAGGDLYIAVFRIFQNEGNAGLLLCLINAGFQRLFCDTGKLCVCFARHNIQFRSGL